MEDIIFGIKTNGKFHYIGKYSGGVNSEGRINKSSIGRAYSSDRIREFYVGNPDVEIVNLKKVKPEEWYDEKLLEVVSKYSENHPLVNAQWMLDGKRGYWSDTDGFWKGKTRDKNTLTRLSESKYKKIMEYDEHGEFVRSWDSIKEVATTVFGDYKVKNGSGCSVMYSMLRSSKLETRLRHGRYWFSESELMSEFGLIPKRLKIAAIIASKKARASACRKVIDKTKICAKKFTIIIYNEDQTIKKKYNNAFEASEDLKIPHETIRRYCKSKKNGFSYGEKTKQRHHKYSDQKKGL